MTLSIKKCTLEDLNSLRQISIDTFFQTFSNSNTAENMKAYLENAYNEDKLGKELCNTDASFFFLFADEKLAGYMKLNEAPSQTDINDSNSLEIERIYILKDFQGAGLGRYMMEYAISSAKRLGKKYVWLGVWEKNDKALRFYKNYKFYRIGEHSFIVGDDPQTDYIMRKDLDAV